MLRMLAVPVPITFFKMLDLSQIESCPKLSEPELRTSDDAKHTQKLRNVMTNSELKTTTFYDRLDMSYGLEGERP